MRDEEYDKCGMDEMATGLEDPRMTLVLKRFINNDLYKFKKIIIRPVLIYGFRSNI